MNTKENNGKRKVIIVTDGDRIARKAIEKAALSIGARTISKTAGNPTHIPACKVISLIKRAKNDPIVVMVDDKGHTGVGNGEQIIWEIAKCEEIDILGVIAVASNTQGVSGIKPDCSITKYGNIVQKTVDKCGNLQEDNVIYGDTVDILDFIRPKVIIGIGDPGKMDGKDDCDIGSPILTKAMVEIIKRSEYL